MPTLRAAGADPRGMHQGSRFMVLHMPFLVELVTHAGMTVQLMIRKQTAPSVLKHKLWGIDPLLNVDTRLLPHLHPLGHRWGYTGRIDTKLLPHYGEFDNHSLSTPKYFCCS